MISNVDAAMGHTQLISWRWELWNMLDLNLSCYLKTYPIISSSLNEEILISRENMAYMWKCQYLLSTVQQFLLQLVWKMWKETSNLLIGPLAWKKSRKFTLLTKEFREPVGSKNPKCLMVKNEVVEVLRPDYFYSPQRELAMLFPSSFEIGNRNQ